MTARLFGDSSSSKRRRVRKPQQAQLVADAGIDLDAAFGQFTD
jgi:hypothetical protein